MIDPDDMTEDGPEEPPLGPEGCLLPDRCCMPGFHFESECFTAEDAAAWMKEENENK